MSGVLPCRLGRCLVFELLFLVLLLAHRSPKEDGRAKRMISHCGFFLGAEGRRKVVLAIPCYGLAFILLRRFVVAFVMKEGGGGMMKSLE